MADIWRAYGEYMAKIRRTYGEYTANGRLTYGELMANIQRTYGEHTTNIRRTCVKNCRGHTAECGHTAPSSVIAAELSMNDQNLVEELRGALERSVQVPAVALRQHVEVVAGCQDYHPPLIRSVVEEKHVSLPEGAAVFGIEVELSKGERGSWTGVKSNLLQGFFARKEGEGIRRQGSSYSREDLVVAGIGGGSNILDFGTCFCSVGVSWVSRMSVEFSYAVEGVIDCVEASSALVAFDTPPGLSTVNRRFSVS